MSHPDEPKGSQTKAGEDEPTKASPSATKEPSEQPAEASAPPVEEPPGDEDGPAADGEENAGEEAEILDDVVVQLEPAAPSVEDRLLAQLEDTRRRLTETEGRLRAVSRAYTDLQKEQAAFRERTTALEAVKAERKRAELVESFFEPVQNLKRSAEAADADNPLTVGLGMVLQQFADTFAKLGLVEVPGVGAPFNPAVHEALAVMPTDQAVLDGRVIAVHNGGWMIGSRTIQAAQVVIGQYTPPPEPEVIDVEEEEAADADAPVEDAAEETPSERTDEPSTDDEH